ncbi:MAG: Npt1/Npt2 family nucleotide transporter, partial [Acidobacteriota bacterium]
MTKNRLGAVLGRVVNLKPGEETISVLLFSYFFLIQAPYYIIKPLRNASFLEQVGGVYLPLPYFLTALVMGLIVNFHSRLQVKLPRYRLLISSLVFFFLNVLLFWWFFEQNWRWVPVAFWVWANIFAVVLVTQFWILVNDVFNPREARRLIGFIGSGGLLGSIFGSLIEGSLAKTKAGDSLLLIAAGLMVLGILIIRSIFALQKRRAVEAEPEAGVKERKDHRPNRVGFRDAWATVNKSTYLKLLAGIVMITWVVSALVDFQFNNVVEQRVAGGANLKSFFGYFNAATMAFAFLFQLLLTSRIIRNFGIRLTLLFYPLVMFLCSGGIGAVAFASLVPAVLIKASDKSLAYSLNQSVRELLYIPISPGQKYQAKVFIDMFLNRFAKGLGAILLVPIVLLYAGEAGIRTIGEGGIRTISLVVIFLIAAWLVLNLRVSREYTNTVKDKIKPRWERADWLLSQKVDVDYTKLVFDTLESRERSSVLYAMHLFDLIRQDKLTPELKRLISYKSDEIRVASLGTLIEQGETGLRPFTEDELSEDVLKKEVQEI